MIKTFLRKFFPSQILYFYHCLRSFLADFIFGHPSGKIKVIGVTGTKGKSSVCFILARILEEAGFKVGVTSTLLIKIAEKEWLNTYKMTMLDPFLLQKFLKEMVKKNCQYAIIETSSEGLAQGRHLGIEYDFAILTNLSPEHIEAHGSFEKYREAKGKLFASLKRKYFFFQKKNSPKTIVLNFDDPSWEWFQQFKADHYIFYGLQKPKINLSKEKISFVIGENVHLGQEGSEITIEGEKIFLSLLGQFNLYNVLAASALALSLGIKKEIIKQALEKIKKIPGRLELIKSNAPFLVFVDYAHNPSSFLACYETIKLIPHERIIHVFGAPGGGRDKRKRPEMGKIASNYASLIILTNDDPYDEDPESIVQMIKKGVDEKKTGLQVILDRKRAIYEACRAAKKGDIVLITGKGAEQKMVLKNKMIDWDDRQVTKEALMNLGYEVEN